MTALYTNRTNRSCLRSFIWIAFFPSTPEMAPYFPGKLNRGLAVVDGMRALMPEGVPDELMFKAQVVGWCIEWLQAAFLVWDDIMDESVTRRGQPCWWGAVSEEGRRGSGIGNGVGSSRFVRFSSIAVRCVNTFVWRGAWVACCS